jgi:hypothetical protein
VDPFNRPLVPVHGTEEILKDLDKHIAEKKPFSTVRYGDGCLGIVCAYIAPSFVKVGKWSGGQKNGIANSVMRQQGIPLNKRLDICKQVVQAANRANYVDSYDAFYTGIGRSKGLGFIASHWKEIHEAVGITNTSYCNPYLHYMSVVYGEYNLHNVMRNRTIFCVSNQVQICEKLKVFSGATKIESYHIGRAGDKTNYQISHEKIMSIIKNNATKYDLFLIGAGLLGKIYCDYVKQCGGRSFDAGRLFDLWSGVRVIDSVPKRFLRMDTKTMLARRILKPDSKVW